jgi:hypothetical protein
MLSRMITSLRLKISLSNYLYLGEHYRLAHLTARRVTAGLQPFDTHLIGHLHAS